MQLASNIYKHACIYIGSPTSRIINESSGESDHSTDDRIFPAEQESHTSNDENNSVETSSVTVTDEESSTENTDVGTTTSNIPTDDPEDCNDSHTLEDDHGIAADETTACNTIDNSYIASSIILYVLL